MERVKSFCRVKQEIAKLQFLWKGACIQMTVFFKLMSGVSLAMERFLRCYTLFENLWLMNLCISGPFQLTPCFYCYEKLCLVFWYASLLFIYTNYHGEIMLFHNFARNCYIRCGENMETRKLFLNSWFAIFQETCSREKLHYLRGTSSHKDTTFKGNSFIFADWRREGVGNK